MTTTNAHRRLASVACLGILGASILSACGSSDDKKAESGSGSTDFAAAQTAAKAAAEKAKAPITDRSLDLQPVDNVDLKGKTILVVPLAGFLFTDAVEAFKQALEPTGAKVSVCDGKANPTEVSTCLGQAQNLDASAVVTFAVSPKIAGNSYKDLADAKIPVYAAWQSKEDTPPSDLLRFADSLPSVRANAEVAVDQLIATAKKPIHILNLGIADNPSIKTISAYISDKIAGDCPTCEVDTELLVSSKPAGAKTAVSGALLKDPDLGAVITINVDTFGAEIIDGVASSNADSDNLTVGGQAGGLNGMKLLADGRVNYVALFSANYTGWVAADGVVRMIAGAEQVDYPVMNRLFDASNVKDLELTPTAAASFDWFGEPTYQDQIRASWGVE